MKTFNTIVLSTVMAMCSSTTVLALDQHQTGDMNHEMMGMMADPGERSMMMDQIAKNPEMRQEMMQKMMYPTGESPEMYMQKMMSNPEMRAKMQKHLNMMQAMLDTDGTDQAKMQEMMSNPEMKSMMEKHMMCGQMMHAGTMGEKADDKDADEAMHDHSN